MSNREKRTFTPTDNTNLLKSHITYDCPYKSGGNFDNLRGKEGLLPCPTALRCTHNREGKCTVGKS
jgi:hypothetical protein